MKKNKGKANPSKKQEDELMAEGYKVMADELRQFAAMAARIEHEVWPE